MKKVAAKFDFINMEHDVLNFWEKESCFKQLQEKNKDGIPFRFLDGPITANNPMGIHHAWGRTLKDIFLRYKAMHGYTSHYRNGFDAQGLWVEVEVEKELGFKTKKDIEDYGLDNFTNKCMERVDRFSKVITEQSKRLGQWMDWDNSYYTNTDENITSIWYFLKKCYDQGMLKESFRPMPWCPRCGTSLSEHEMAGSYQNMIHKAVYFKLLVADIDSKIVVWTTTPWTLSANVALAVNPDIDYVKVKVKSDDKPLVLSAKALKLLKDDKVEVLETIKGKDLVGLKYEACFEEFEKQQALTHQIVAWDDVSETDGTGIVHIAPGCGAEDFELGQSLGLEVVIPVDDNGVIVDGFGFMTGNNTKDVAALVFAELEKRNKLYKVEEHEHSYPVCWRCKNEVIFKAVREWVIDSDQIRDRLINASQSVKWMPDYAGKRMEDWLNNMGNWAISRKRFYGLPLPIYPCDCGHLTVVGSLEELTDLAVDQSKIEAMPHLHRPWIDDVLIKCPNCGKPVKRITDVGDCWLDAGIVPFSTLKFFTDKEYWNKYFPAEWITEMKEQIRLWFYSMLFMSVVLEDKAPYESALTHGAVIKEDGGKFSKSGFMIKFDEAAEQIGADAARYIYAGAPTNNDVRFGFNLGDEARRKLLNFWNIYVFFNTYAVLDKPNLANYQLDATELDKTDQWLLARLNQFITKATNAMEKFETQLVIKEFELIVDDISNFYVRVNRKRFYGAELSDDKLLAYYLLYTAIKQLSQVMAPIIPFMSEEIWQNMVRTMEPDAEISVHLSSYPKVDEQFTNDNMLSTIEEVRKLITMGMMLRNEHQLKVKQPLNNIFIKANENIIEFKNIILEELNVKHLELLEDETILNDEYFTVNFKSAGQLFKEKIQEFKQVVENLSEEETKQLLLDYKNCETTINIKQFKDIAKEALTISVKPKADVVVISDNNMTVGLDVKLTEDLVVEGMSRELVRAIQVLRKDSGFEVEDRINLSVVVDGPLMNLVLANHIAKIKQETLAEEFTTNKLSGNAAQKDISINGEAVYIQISK